MQNQTKPTFTPGPWTFSLESRDIIKTEVGCNSILVAQLYKDSRTQANAALIAAAPSLFSVLDTFSQEDLDWNPDTISSFLEQARYAVSKARGE